MEENRILKEAIAIRKKRLHMKIGYNLTAFIVGTVGFVGIWYYGGWQLSLFILIFMWGNNISNKANEL